MSLLVDASRVVLSGPSSQTQKRQDTRGSTNPKLELDRRPHCLLACGLLTQEIHAHNGRATAKVSNPNV